MSDGPYDGKPFKAGAAIAIFTPTKDGSGRVETLLDDPNGMIRDLDVSHDGERVLFSWKKNQYNDDYHIYEMTVATKKVRANKGVRNHFLSQQPHFRTLNRLLQNPLECVVVFRLLEDRHPRIRPIQNVINQPAVSYSMWSSHAQKLPKRRPLVKKKVPDTFVAPRLFPQRSLDAVGDEIGEHFAALGVGVDAVVG